MIRLSQDKNKFEMVVDGCTFDDWLRNRGLRRQEERKKPVNFSLEEKSQNDPFAEFGMVTKKASSKNNDHNAFGNFEDFGFTGGSQTKLPSSTTVASQQPLNPSFEE